MKKESILNKDWSAPNRNKYIERLKNEKFELIIIGGGMTGAGIAREAALRGIKTALIDKDDFAFGTSSRSTKLAHGGIRYLAQGEFKIVRESTTERNWMRNHFPHNVRPLAFNFCSYEGGKDKPYLIRIALTLYHILSDWFSKYKNYKKHTFYSPEEFKKIEPTVKTDGLILAGQYYDTNLDDARITMEGIKESVVIGDVVALNYAKCVGYVLENNKIQGIKVKDQLTNEEFEVLGTQIVNATGIWTDDLLRNYKRKIIRPTKGVHVFVRNDRIGNNAAFGLRSVDDGRFYFVLKREEFSVIGTTDTDYKGDFNTPWCDKDDCDYLFHSVNLLFPDANLTYDDIISTYAGIRPLVVDENAKSESDVSRKHVIFDTEDGLTTIAGGKLTIWRLMGEELIYHLINEKNAFNREFPKKMLKKGFSKQPFLIGLERKEFDKFLSENNILLSQDILDYLYRQYGFGSFEILNNIKENPNLGERFIEENQFCPAEVDYILKYEMAPKLVDVLIRRTEIQLKVHHKKQNIIANKVADIMAKAYNWDEDRKRKEVDEYLEYISNTVWF